VVERKADREQGAVEAALDRTGGKQERVERVETGGDTGERERAAERVLAVGMVVV